MCGKHESILSMFAIHFLCISIYLMQYISVVNDLLPIDAKCLCCPALYAFCKIWNAHLFTAMQYCGLSLILLHIERVCAISRFWEELLYPWEYQDLIGPLRSPTVWEVGDGWEKQWCEMKATFLIAYFGEPRLFTYQWMYNSNFFQISFTKRDWIWCYLEKITSMYCTYFALLLVKWGSL